MPHKRWMLYGAYGFTGQLIVEEAVRRGHRPILAGRSQEKLVPVAQRLGLDWIVRDLQDINALTDAVVDVDLVLHAAGPFIYTSEPMVRACLAGGTHYVDITGELPVFQNTFSYDRAARRRGITLMSGTGFGVIPTDCLAKYVTDQLADAIDLEIAIAPSSRTSAGTTKTTLELLPRGGRVRRNGWLVPYPLGQGAKWVRFARRAHTVLPIPWGDLETAYWTAGIPNITTYMTYPHSAVRLIHWTAPVIQRLLAVAPVRRLAQRWVERRIQGPDATMRRTGRSSIWACAANAHGHAVQAWLEIAESYHFTAIGSVHCVEAILEQCPRGALTPALAFGADFVLTIPGTQRFDSV